MSISYIAHQTGQRMNLPPEVTRLAVSGDAIEAVLARVVENSGERGVRIEQVRRNTSVVCLECGHSRGQLRVVV
jgi:hypothetical protein